MIVPKADVQPAPIGSSAAQRIPIFDVPAHHLRRVRSGTKAAPPDGGNSTSRKGIARIVDRYRRAIAAAQ